VASHGGFANFELLLKSDLLKPVVSIEIGRDGQPVYMPKADPRFKHIRDIQIASFQYQNDKADRDEQEKINRANLPENRGKLFEGRKILTQLVFELGGEKRDIDYDEVRKLYEEKFGRVLDQDELKSYFQRRTISRILDNYLSDEIIRSVCAQYEGKIFVRLKRPYHEIQKMHERIVAEQLAGERMTQPYQKTGRYTTKIRRQVPKKGEIREPIYVPPIPMSLSYPPLDVRTLYPNSRPMPVRAKFDLSDMQTNDNGSAYFGGAISSKPK